MLQDIGSIEVSLKFLPREGTIIVGINQARGLPHHQITGPPGRVLKSSKQHIKFGQYMSIYSKVTKRKFQLQANNNQMRQNEKH